MATCARTSNDQRRQLSRSNDAKTGIHSHLSVSRIKAQPFLLTALVNHRARRHVPGYLLRTSSSVIDEIVREGERRRISSAILPQAAGSMKCRMFLLCLPGSKFENGKLVERPDEAAA